MLRSTVILWSLLTSAVFVVFVFCLSSVLVTNIPSSWLVRLCLNLLGYSTILVPGYFVSRYAAKRRDASLPDHCAGKLIRSCFIGCEDDEDRRTIPENEDSPETSTNTLRDARVLTFCALGLGGSYLIWGFLQEKIMTTDYRVSSSTKTARFSDSQFLVFVNRISAFVLSGCGVAIAHSRRRSRRHAMPLYKYSYCSFSNVMSSWCQYEALKFVSFPIQVLCKACKVIPVMAMGKIVSRKTYARREYATALLMSLGMAMFLLGSAEERADTATETTFVGLVILAGYMAFDSFTSNWQQELFARHGMTWVQMMCGVNLFSCLLTGVSLLQQGGFVGSLRFARVCPRFVVDVVVLSGCSAVGQMFVFYTISQFGAVVFAYVMTLRQCLAVLLSCFVYEHPVDVVGVAGIVLVFLAVFARSCWRSKPKPKTEGSGEAGAMLEDAAIVIKS